MECLGVGLDVRSFQRLGAASESALRAGHDRVEAETAPGGELWRFAGEVVALRDAQTWDPRARLASAAARIAGIGAEALDAARGELARQFAAGRPSDGIHVDGPYSRRFRELLEAPEFPLVLVGFGPGTTPAGDDFIAGYLLARNCFYPEGYPAKTARSSLDLSRTTFAGRSLLTQALAGGFPEIYLRLAESVAGIELASAEAGGEDMRGPSVPRARIAGVVSAMLAHGATSGADALAGYLFGWNDRRP